jgi:transaldolase
MQTVVCDSGDFVTIDRYKPQDATTNPSLILAASKKPEYGKLIDAAVAWGKTHGHDIDDQVDATLDCLLVQFGKEILNIVPGKVSTEVDARFSFDTEASVKKALRIIDVTRFAVAGPELYRRLTSCSCTRSGESAKNASSSRSSQRGRASRLLRSSSRSTESM